MHNLLAILQADEPDDAEPSDPATLLAQADVQLIELQQVFAARNDTTYLDRVRELRQVLRRLRQSTGNASK